MKKCCIFYNDEKTKAVKIYEEAKQFISEKNIAILSRDRVFEADFVLVIGGDGTLLTNFRYINDVFTERNKEILPPFIAINAGSMGYLTEATEDNYRSIIDDYLEDSFHFEDRHILEINHKDKRYYALNELVVSRQNIQTTTVTSKIVVDDNFLARYKGDGVIVATPTGSTAYSLSVGGPIIVPSLKLFLVSPIATHNLNTRPIILDGNSKIKISLDSPSEYAYLIIDGKALTEISIKDEISIDYSTKTIRLLLSKDRNYYDVLRKKLKWGDSYA